MNFRLAAIPAAIAFVSVSAFAATAWNTTTSYVGGEVVTYSGKDYKAKWWTQGDVPGATQWGPWEVQAGTGGTATATPGGATPTPVASTPTPAAGACTNAAWAPGNYTAQSAAVSHKGNNYKAKWWTTAEPSASASEWTNLGPCSTGNATPTPVVTANPATPTPVVTAIPATPTPVVTPTPGNGGGTVGGKQVGTYFAEWSIYGRQFYLKNVQDSGAAAKLTFLNYSFANVYNRGGKYVCDASVNKAETGNQDGGDAWAVYQKGFSAAESVDGVADIFGWPTWDDPRNGVSGPLKGNLNQLKKLKAKNPNLKAVISLGGWTWSKWFSAAAATPELRQTLVASCIDVWIKGNLPFDSGANAGGPGVAAGVFDGIDIDWEYPGAQGIGTNTVSPADKQNNNLLMAEFRKQLDALSKTTGKKYLLTVAIGAGDDKIAATEPAEYSKYLDWINIMSYDYNGGWDAQGPTDFHSNLYQDPASPRTVNPTTGKVSRYYTDAAVKDMIARGTPASKLHIGVPFYGRGWTGVTNANNGLYQKATGPAKGTYEAGFEDYKVLKNAPGTEYIHPVTKQTYRFDGTTFWSYDTPRDIKLKADYAKSMGLGGMFSWEIDGDTTDAALTEAMTHINK